MISNQYLKHSSNAALAGFLAVALVITSFFLLEPRISVAQTNVSTFTITQMIGDEISFLVPANNILMQGTLNGLTGGDAYGSTTVSVRTNAPLGYNMTIAFFDNGSVSAMRGTSTLSDAIRNHPNVAGQPRYAFDTSSTSAVFGYTVSALNPDDVDQSFLHDNSDLCNQSSGFTTNQATTCWMTPSFSNFTIIDRATAATGGATSTVYFRVHVPMSPTPGLVADGYVATATLTALNNN